MPKGFKGLSIDASSPPAGYDSGAMSQPASSLPPDHHTGGVTGGGVSDQGAMNKVSFVIVRADQVGLCRATVNAGFWACNSVIATNLKRLDRCEERA